MLPIFIKGKNMLENNQFCSSCGTENKLSEKFCANCGNILQQDPPKTIPVNENKNAFFVGVISYIILQALNIAYLFIFSLLKNNYAVKSLIWFVVISVSFVGAMGGLLSLIFIKIQLKIPIQNIYLKSGLFHLLVSFLFALPQMAKPNIPPHYIFNLVASFLIGLLCIHLYLKKCKKI